MSGKPLSLELAELERTNPVVRAAAKRLDQVTRELTGFGLDPFDVEPEVACVVCGCTDSQACPGGCAWTFGTPPTCTACADDPRFAVGARVRVKAGKFTDRLGTVKRRPSKTFSAWRYVQLDRTPRQRKERSPDFIHIKDLEGA